MKLPDLILTGWDEIKAHKMRSFLSFFAIAIGIATFFYTLSVLSQNYRDINRAVKIGGQGRISTSTQHLLSLAQYQALLQMLPQGSSLSLETDWGWNSFFYKGKEIVYTPTVGVLPSWQDADFAYRLEGRFFNWQDIKNRQRVAVLIVFPREKEKHFIDWSDPSETDSNRIPLKDLVYRHNLLNQTLSIDHENVKVIGILHVPAFEQDPRFARYRDRMYEVLLPYTTWQDIQAIPDMQDQYKTKIRILTGDDSTAALAATQTVSFLRSQFGIEEKPEINFFKNEVTVQVKNAYAELKKMLFLGLIAMVAGGIGIMNVTMAVIYSRTKEIGIRRALGATRIDILFQFLIEAMLLGLCGSIAGMVLGYGALLHTAQKASQMTFSWWVVVLSVLIGLVTSFLFALYPAWQAAKLKPVDALKYE